MKKAVALILESIPVLSALTTYPLIFMKADGDIIRWIINITMALAFLGFVFFITGRKLAKDHKPVRILGIFDLIATASVIGFYILVFIGLAS